MEFWSGFDPLFGTPKAEQEKGIGAFSAPMPVTAARSAGCHGGLRDFEIDADFQSPNMLWRYSLGKCPFAPCFQGF